MFRYSPFLSCLVVWKTDQTKSHNLRTCVNPVLLNKMPTWLCLFIVKQFIMTKLPSSIQKLINELSKLPGVGPKTAQRLAFYLLKKDSIDLNNLSQSISQVKSGIVFCSTCYNMGEADPCFTCVDPKRDKS